MDGVDARKVIEGNRSLHRVKGWEGWLMGKRRLNRASLRMMIEMEKSSWCLNREMIGINVDMWRRKVPA
jgi:hypothetical protein